MTLTRSNSSGQQVLLDQILQIAGNQNLFAADFEKTREQLCQALISLGYDPATGARCISEHSSPASSPRTPKISANRFALLLRPASPSSGSPASSPTLQKRRMTADKATLLATTPPASPRRATLVQHDLAAALERSVMDDPFNTTIEPICKLIRLLQAPVIFILPFQEQPDEAIRSLQAMENELTTHSLALETAREDSTHAHIRQLLTQLSGFYAQTRILIAEQALGEPPVILAGDELGYYQISQNLAYQLLGMPANGQAASMPRFSIHYVTAINHVFYKLANGISGIDMGMERFVKSLLSRLFPEEAPRFLTPSTLLRLSNIMVDGKVEKEPQFLNASLAVKGFSLKAFLICKEIADKLTRNYQNDVQTLKHTIGRWIRGDFVSSSLAEHVEDLPHEDIMSIFKKIKAVQLELFSGSSSPRDNDTARILEFKQVQPSESCDKIIDDFKKLHLIHGAKQFSIVTSFILTWPELVAGFNLHEIFDWVPVLLKIPTLFQGKCRTSQIDHTFNFFANFWDMLDKKAALALAIGSLITGVEDGKGDNYQCEILFEAEQVCGWRIVWIDIGGEVLKNPITSNFKSITPRTPHSPRQSLKTSGENQQELIHTAGIKSQLFFLESILTIPLYACSFNSETPEEILSACLALAQTDKEAYTSLQRMNIFDKRTPESESGMPVLFNSEELAPLHHKMTFVANYLEEHSDTGTFGDLFHALFPTLALAYRSMLHAFNGNPRKAFDWMLWHRLTELPASEANNIASLESALASHKAPSTNSKIRNLHVTDALFSLLRAINWVQDGKATEQALAWLEPLATHFPQIRLYDSGVTADMLNELLVSAIKRSEKVSTTQWLSNQGALPPAIHPEWQQSTSRSSSPTLFRSGRNSPDQSSPLAQGYSPRSRSGSSVK